MMIMEDYLMTDHYVVQIFNPENQTWDNCFTDRDYVTSYDVYLKQNAKKKRLIFIVTEESEDWIIS
jgi:hypothetical protein